MELLIGEIVRRNAEVVGHQVAASLGDATLTHAALDAQGNRIAHALRSLGVRRGDRVLSWADTCLEVLPLFVTLLDVVLNLVASDRNCGRGHTLLDRLRRLPWK